MTSVTPLISIIIPMYNAAQYIGFVLEAATNQTCKNLEVVVVDDGSNDDSAQIVKACSDKRVRYIHQENRGQSAAINRGVRESHGDFIKILDADDWIPPEHVTAQLDALHGHPNSVASCRWGYFADNFHLPDVREEHTGQSYENPMQWLIDSLTKDEGMMGGWMWLIPRHIWNKCGGYDERLSLNNDFHFSIALTLASDGIRFAHSAVYSYRKAVAGALSGSSSRKAMESAMLTTQLGTTLLLAHTNSQVIRTICADRFQFWLYQFYPEHHDLADIAAQRVCELGGSDVPLRGGGLLNALLPIIGWKAVRKLQFFAYRNGWQVILERKSKSRTKELQ